ncbi:hypothetical protein GCM10027589_33290 [Actinocorallia lasiicapitis]
MRRPLALATVLAGLLVVLLPLPSRAAPAGFADPGPYPVAVLAESKTTFYYPRDIAQSPITHPVIIWGNGTFATPSAYTGLLKHWASQGFIVAAANTTMSNNGADMRAGIDRLITKTSNPSSKFFAKVDLAHIGASGHSQGGAGAIVASADSRVTTTVPIQPGPLASSSTLRGPSLFLSGENDNIVQPSWVKNFYTAASHVPAVYAKLAGANHFEATGDGGGFRGLSTAWFRFQLMGDESARGVFFGADCTLCVDPAWLDVQRNAKAQQIPGA